MHRIRNVTSGALTIPSLRKLIGVPISTILRRLKEEQLGMEVERDVLVVDQHRARIEEPYALVLRTLCLPRMKPKHEKYLPLNARG
jgi:hypothetical protein